MDATPRNKVKGLPEWVLLRHVLTRRLWGTMTGRVWLLLIAGIALSVALTYWLVRSEGRDNLREAYQAAQIERVATFAQALASSSPEGRPSLLVLGARMGLIPILESYAEQIPSHFKEQAARSHLLSTALESEAKIWRGEEKDCTPLMPDQPPHKCTVAQWRTDDGLLETFLLVPPVPPTSLPSEARVVLSERHRPPSWLPMSFLQGWLGLGILLTCLLALAWAIAKLALRPLQQLTRAVQGFGQNVEQGAIAETGPSEIRNAMHTFNQMQQRIRENLAQRTQMMAAITHDLQTPLTRLRLRLEKVEDAPLREKLLEDWQDAQSRIQEGLDLARSLDEQEPLQTVDVAALVESVCWDAADAGQPVHYQADAKLPQHLTIRARPAALKRCVENLVGNAVRYGAPSDAQPVCVQLAQGSNGVEITVRDFGQGIPEADLEAVFEPFKRLETSRSRASGGSGLGLAIVRNLMHRQGGSVRLQNHPEGGLLATLYLPSK